MTKRLILTIFACAACAGVVWAFHLYGEKPEGVSMMAMAIVGISALFGGGAAGIITVGAGKKAVLAGCLIGAAIASIGGPLGFVLGGMLGGLIPFSRCCEIIMPVMAGVGLLAGCGGAVFYATALALTR